MPRKPNRRETQPYVPAGHGDESGEYRGYESTDTYRPGYKPKGDGKGKVIPKKNVNVNDRKELNIAIEEKDTPSEIDSKNLYDAVIKTSNFKPKELETIKESIDKGSAEENRHLEKALKSGKYKLRRLDSEYKQELSDKGYRVNNLLGSCFIPQFQDLLLQPKDAKTNSMFGQGVVFYHESGHLVDNYYNNISLTFKDENGNLLVDMLSKDGEVLKSSGGLQEIEKAKNQALTQALRERNEVNSPIVDKQQELSKKIPIIEDKYQNMWFDKIEKKYQDSNGMMPSVNSLEYYTSDEFKQAVKEIKEIEKQKKALNRTKLKVEDTKAWKEYESAYSDVGDMIDGTLGRWDNPTTFGHDIGYWRESNRAKECFAECFSAKAINPKSKEMIKKYFPSAFNFFEKILRSLENE